MSIPNPAAKINNINRYRDQVISSPLAQQLSPDEVTEYLAKLPKECFPTYAYNNASMPQVQPRGGFPTYDSQYKLTRLLHDAGADFIPLTIDSCTRQNQYETAQQLLQRSEDEGKNYLNGYPLICHGYELTRELYQGIKKPISLRHGTPDARLLAEVAIASGITEIEGGGICYCLPYSEGFPLDRSLLYWQYVDRICAIYSTEEKPIHRESFGPLSATMVPPAIVICVQIIEALLAAEQGVTSIAVSFGQTGSFVQDIALADVLKRLTRKYLDDYGFHKTRNYLVYHQWMGQFPPQRAKAASLISGSTLISSMISADKIVVKTVDEALGVPDMESNSEAVETVKYLLQRFKCPEPVNSVLITEETRLIESEVASIMQSIFEMPGEYFWESVFRAFQLGYLDVPFSPHADNANKLITMRDKNGSIRITEKGNLPISKKDADLEKQLLIAGLNDGEKNYLHLLSDINIMV